MSVRRPLFPEGSLIAFTLLAQAAAGAGIWSFALRVWAAGTARSGAGFTHDLAAAAAAVAAGDADASAGAAHAGRFFPPWLDLLAAVLILCALAVSVLHLGSPRRAWKAAANWRSSWLSREILFALFFAAVLSLSILAPPVEPPAMIGEGAGFPPGLRIFLLAAVPLFALALLLSMSRAYLLRTVPAWNRWTTPASFLASAVVLGSAVVFGLAGATGHFPRETGAALTRISGLLALAGLAAQWGLRAAGSKEGAAALARAGRIAALFGILLFATVVLLAPSLGGAVSSGLRTAALLSAASSECLGRALFYHGRHSGRI